MRSTLTALSLLLLAGGACAQEGYSAKSLFFAQDDTVVSAATSSTKPATAPIKSAAAKARPAGKAPAKQIGASYFIRLNNADGTQRDVLASRRFKTGERFQLGVKVNRPTYIYILNQDADGKVTQIYPQPGGDNLVNAMGTVFLPAKGSFEFDQKPGVEQLLVYLSPTPMPGMVSESIRSAQADLISLPPDALAAASCADRQYAAKGIAFKDEVSACAASAPTYAAKGIVFSEDSSAPAANDVHPQAAYVVKTVAKADNSLYLKLNLVHE